MGAKQTQCGNDRHMFIQAGMDVDHDEIRIVESLPSKSETHSLDGLRALQENLADSFWGNGMRLALAEKAGIASCISIYAAATVRQTRAIIILPH